MTGAGVAARLLRWYDAHRRDLPWRDVGDPWATWVSEIMLQQTRVEAVREAFARFMASYPPPAAWAAWRSDHDEAYEKRSDLTIVQLGASMGATAGWALENSVPNSFKLSSSCWK